MKVQSAYTDTSVFGGVFDDEFTVASRDFFDLVRRGVFELLISDISRKEIASAPAQVISLFDEMLALLRVVSVDDEILRLRDAYVSAGIVGDKWADDAGHVAAATIGMADLIVSWNFKHIVHFDKIRRYNAINLLNGYREIDIRSPAEVIYYDDQD
ncbi:MAG: type II toxin-antitoxin system VapC family toxin [Pirellulaceae bacterium]|nr:type II toxin-antitoxin system VapC family toxin [Pirellulaceae bacterium]